MVLQCFTIFPVFCGWLKKACHSIARAPLKIHLDPDRTSPWREMGERLRYSQSQTSDRGDRIEATQVGLEVEPNHRLKNDGVRQSDDIPYIIYEKQCGKYKMFQTTNQRDVTWRITFGGSHFIYLWLGASLLYLWFDHGLPSENCDLARKNHAQGITGLFLSNVQAAPLAKWCMAVYGLKSGDIISWKRQPLNIGPWCFNSTQGMLGSTKHGFWDQLALDHIWVNYNISLTKLNLAAIWGWFPL